MCEIQEGWSQRRGAGLLAVHLDPQRQSGGRISPDVDVVDGRGRLVRTDPQARCAHPGHPGRRQPARFAAVGLAEQPVGKLRRQQVRVDGQPDLGRDRLLGEGGRVGLVVPGPAALVVMCRSVSPAKPIESTRQSRSERHHTRSWVRSPNRSAERGELAGDRQRQPTSRFGVAAVADPVGLLDSAQQVTRPTDRYWPPAMRPPQTAAPRARRCRPALPASVVGRSFLTVRQPGRAGSIPVHAA